MQSDTVRWWCCSSSVDKAPPPVLERHLTYFPPSQHLYMIIWYLHSFYTRWFESGAVFGVWLPQKVIDKWLWRIFIGCAVTTLVSRCLCCCPGSLHLDTALLVKWDTYSGPHGLTHMSLSLPPCAYQQFSDFCAWQLNKSSCQHFYFSYLCFTPSLLPPLLVLQLHEVLSHAYRFYLRFVFTVLMDKASFQSAAGIKR